VLNSPHHERIYAIGDVHGCLGMMQALVAQIRADAIRRSVHRPKLILLGDLIDRGPDSCGVLAFVSSEAFQREFDVTFIRGNHEQILLDLLDEPDGVGEWFQRGGAEVVESYGLYLTDHPRSTLARLWDVFPGEHLRLLKSSVMSCRVGDIFFSHAGPDPSYPLDRQFGHDLMWGSLWFTERETDDVLPEGVLIVHGHYASFARQVVETENTVNLDSGAGFQGGRLSAMAFDPNGDRELFQVGPAWNAVDLPLETISQAA
jgi:serine/threonine protein phosphatase 1